MIREARDTGKGHQLGGAWTDTKLQVCYLGSYTTALKDKPTKERPFQKAYKEIFMGIADKPGELRSSSNCPLYLFCFATANKNGAPIALKIANHLLKGLL